MNAIEGFAAVLMAWLLAWFLFALLFGRQSGAGRALWREWAPIGVMATCVVLSAAVVAWWL